MSNIDWTKIDGGVIAAFISAIAAAVGLIFQRIDLKKQSKYQRATFELQNEIIQNNILIELGSDIVGNIQAQLLTLQQIFQDQILMRHNIYELEKENYPKYKNNREQEYSKVDELRDEISKFSNEIDELNNYSRNLGKDLISKSNALQFHMIGRENYQEIKRSLDAVSKLLTKMQEESEELKSITKENLPDEKYIKDWTEKYRKDINNYTGELQKCFILIKMTSLDKQKKLEKEK